MAKYRVELKDIYECKYCKMAIFPLQSEPGADVVYAHVSNAPEVACTQPDPPTATPA